MKIIKYPDRDKWKYLLKRPAQDNSMLDITVKQILGNVKKDGDAALRKYNLQFDKYKSPELIVPDSEIRDAKNLVQEELKKSIIIAKANIESFHRSQEVRPEVIETTPGVLCWRENRAIDKVGLYIPGGTAPSVFFRSDAGHTC